MDSGLCCVRRVLHHLGLGQVTVPVEPTLKHSAARCRSNGVTSVLLRMRRFEGQAECLWGALTQGATVAIIVAIHFLADVCPRAG